MEKDRVFSSEAEALEVSSYAEHVGLVWVIPETVEGSATGDTRNAASSGNPPSATKPSAKGTGDRKSKGKPTP